MKMTKFILIPTALIATTLLFNNHIEAKTYNQNGLTLGDTSTFKPGIQEEIGTLLNKHTDSLTKKQLIDYFKIKGYHNIGSVIKAAKVQGYNVSQFEKYKNHKGWN